MTAMVANMNDVPPNELKFPVPHCDQPPASWWDADADKSLMVGTYRHGYERYNMMRLDPDLSFLARCGPPDSNEIQEEQLKDESPEGHDENSKLDEDDDSLLSSRTPNESRASSVKPEDEAGSASAGGGSQLTCFPAASELNGRLRRLISAYQREYKKEEARLAAKEKRTERRERIEQVIREREQQKIDMEQRKWNKKEENDFLRTLLSYGVEFSQKDHRYIWDRFKQLARLDQKFDDTLSEYCIAFLAMCKKVTGKSLGEAEELLQAGVEPIGKEKAELVLERMEIMDKLRNEVIPKGDLDKRLLLCDTAQDLPDWWIPGKHDRDLMIGVARHGLSKMEYYVLNDPDLCFKDILKRHLCGESLLDPMDMTKFLERKKYWAPLPEPDPPSPKEEKKPKDNEEDEGDKKKKPAEEEVEDADEVVGDDESTSKKKNSGESKSKKKPSEEEEEELLRIAEAFQETRSRRKSTKDATRSTKIALEQQAKANEKARRSSERSKSKDKDHPHDKENGGENHELPDDKSVKDEEDGKDSKDENHPEGGPTPASSSKNGEVDGSKPKEAVKEEAPEEVKESKTVKSTPTPKKVKRSYTVSIAPPHISVHQMEQMAKGGLLYDMDMMNELMAQTYAATIKWPKDKILEVRLTHIMTCVETGKWPVPDDYALGEHLPIEDDTPIPPVIPEVPRDTHTPMSEVSDLSAEDQNVLTHASGRKRSRGRKPLDFSDEKSKIRALLQQPTLSAVGDDDPRGLPKTPAGVEITPVNGDVDNALADLPRKTPLGGKPSKLESALDRFGMQKRKLADEKSDDKSKKKKRLDDIMFGLGAAKGLNLDKEEAAAAAAAAAGIKASAGSSLLKKDADKVSDLSKLQEMLGPADAKVQKWLADQMGVVPDRPTTPSSTTTTTSALGKSPRSSTSNPMEWMSNLSGDEHVTVFNRFTGKKLSGTQGPKLKYLAQWLIENPMFEVDPKWAELVKNKPADPPKRKGPGRPPLDGEPTSKSSRPSSAGMGPSGINTMAGLGLDPKNPLSSLASLDPKNPMSLAALYGLDPKKLDPMTATLLGLGDPKNPGKLDPMMLAALGMDQKTLQAMGIDPKTLSAAGMDPKAMGMGGMDPKMLQAMGMDPKALQMMGLDAKTLKSMGLDHKSLQSMGIDQKTLQAMGMDPKSMQNMGMDPKLLQAMGLDAKTLQAMGLDQKALQAMEDTSIHGPRP
eukprot:maker-scaffold912_size81766-snap-gene-0.16 protein:Tk07073 transcript:maker-scaffold912_size81766-snap-gene-0.16-mRNA-1 annotation:"hypothetical protein DAPPUDRAFT_319863"